MLFVSRRSESETPQKAEKESKSCMTKIMSKFRSNSSVSTADMLKRMNLHTKQLSSNTDLHNSGVDIPLTSVTADADVVDKNAN